MRFGIKYKVFAILLSVSLLIIIGMFVFTRMTFKQGLIGYMDTMQEKHLGVMCRMLAENYAEEGSWSFLTDNPDSWDGVQRYAFRTWRRLNHGAHPPQPPGRPGHGRPAKDLRGPAPGGGKPGLVLLDQNRHPVLGTLDGIGPKNLVPVVVEGQTVGYLGLSHSPTRIQAEELLFFQRQTRVFLMIALGMVLMSILAAVWTAYYLERPIAVLIRGTQALTSGDLATRIPVTSRDELGQLSDDFNALAQTLEQNEADRKKWVEDIAHELRTPLTLLSGELEALEDGVRDLTPDTVRNLQADIHHLIRLVNDLNELSRTDTGSMNYRKQETDLADLIGQVVDRHAEALGRSGITADVTCSVVRPLVFADPERLKQLFGNIVQNSLDYTASGGRLHIGIDPLGSSVRVRIDDSAPGVPADALGRLFDRLYRVEGSRNRRYGGSGLGLAICRNIVEAHGGRIVASHSPLGGLRLDIELPLTDRKNA
ncbi:two-component system sensor histidine kinase BaeS [Desulfatiferula olefinivorans]